LDFLIGIFLCFNLAFAEAPAPFEKVKEYALQGVCDEEKVCLLEFKGAVNGETYHIAFIYNTLFDVYGIAYAALGEAPYVILYEGRSNQFFRVEASPLGLVRFGILKEEALKEAFKIMRKVVRLNLI